MGVHRAPDDEDTALRRAWLTGFIAGMALVVTVVGLTQLGRAVWFWL